MNDSICELAHRHVPDRRTAIRLAAVRLWGVYGYQAVSLRRIADEAEVSLALITHYFPGKHDLFAWSLDEFSLACEVARRRLLSCQSGQAHRLGIDELAMSLAAPIEQLAKEGAHGRNLLSMWLLHWRDPQPELSVPLGRTYRPLKEAIADLLVQRCPGRSHASMLSVCCIGFAAGITAVLCNDPPSRSALTESGEAPAASLLSPAQLVLATLSLATNAN